MIAKNINLLGLILLLCVSSCTYKIKLSNTENPLPIEFQLEKYLNQEVKLFQDDLNLPFEFDNVIYGRPLIPIGIKYSVESNHFLVISFKHPIMYSFAKDENPFTGYKKLQFEKIRKMEVFENGGSTPVYSVSFEKQKLFKKKDREQYRYEKAH